MEAELEEGEAYDDDTSIDPEIAFSYLVRALFCSLLCVNQILWINL